MAQSDLLRRYLEAGMEFGQITRSRAEKLVKDLVRAGEVQREQTQDWVESLVNRSRQNREQLVEFIRKEIRDQLRAVGVATKDDLAALERRLQATGAGKASAPVKKAPAKTAPAKTAPAKSAARNAAAKKAVPKKAGPGPIEAT